MNQGESLFDISSDDLPMHEDGTRDATPLLERDYSEGKKIWEFERGFDTVHGKRLLEQITSWRERQAVGDIEPRWGEYCEFPVTLNNGRTVVAVYEPASFGVHHDGFATDSLEFHGPLTSTGYRSSFVNRGVEPPEIPLLKFATKHANAVRDETEKEYLKSLKRNKRESKKASRVMEAA